MYLVTETSELSATYFPHRLHALDLATGAPNVANPLLVSDPYMAPLHKLQRPGLLLANGRVYVAIGSMQDEQPFHGVLFAFDAQSLAQKRGLGRHTNGGPRRHLDGWSSAVRG